MSTTLDPQFMRAVVLITGFKPNLMRRTQAALLLIGLRCESFTAASLPGEICDGDKHLAGAATGSLIAAGLLIVTGRIKSPCQNAKGRKLDLLQVASIEKAKSWLKANDVQMPQETAQPELL